MNESGSESAIVSYPSPAILQQSPSLEAEPDPAPSEPPEPRGAIVAREGLPAGFRMRHDAHYVEALTARPPSPVVRRIALAQLDGDVVAKTASERFTRSIARDGILVPLLVAPRGSRFKVIDGQHRLRAALASGIEHVPCVVIDLDDAAAADLRGGANLRGDEDAARVPAATAAQLLPGLAATLDALASQVDSYSAGLGLFLSRRAFRLDLKRAARVARAGASGITLPKLKRRPTAVADIARKLADRQDTDCREAGVRLKFDVKEGSATVMVDAALIVQALEYAVDASLACLEQALEADNVAAGEQSLLVRLQHSAAAGALVIEVIQPIAWPARDSDGDPLSSSAAVGAGHTGSTATATLLAAADRISRWSGGHSEVRRERDQATSIVVQIPCERLTA